MEGSLVIQGEGKTRFESLVSPEAYLDYLKRRGRLPAQAPPLGVIICYHSRLFDFICKNHKVTKGDGFANWLSFLDETHGQIAVTKRFGVGAPAAVILAEELIAWGVKSFVSVGTAGTLQSTINIGDTVLCEKAIRKEGTSFHYLEPSKYVEASQKLTDRLEAQLKQKKLKYYRGTTWTTDAPYRETMEDVRSYQAEGVATVEMEASALFALGIYRKVEVSAMLSVSDSLADLKWNPQFHSDKTHQSLEEIFQVAKQALVN